MEQLKHLLQLVNDTEFSGNPKCIERLDNILQDALIVLKTKQACSELLELKSCSWTLHERYYMDTDEALKWTFYHTKHRMVKCLSNLIEIDERKLESELVALGKKPLQNRTITNHDPLTV